VTIKNYFSKPSTWAKRGVAAFFIAGASMLLASCGGGGAESPTVTPPTATLQLLPGTATLFATVPANYVASGGLPPYTLLTSNAAVLPVPTGTLSGSNFSLTPNVVSANTDVTVTLRDSAGITATAVATVNPNFVNGNLTVRGNGVESPSFTGCTDIGFVCAGQFGTVTVTLTQNGAPVRARSVRFSADQGAYQFVANVVNNTLVQTIDVTTDETGTATAIIRGNVNATLQVALIRATDILTGAYRLSSFVIRQTTLTGTDFTTVPTSWAVAGFIKNQCPGGVVDYIIFGGTAPYTIRSPLSDVIVSPTTTNSDNPNRFTASFSAQPCGDVGYSPIFTITDATGRTITADLSVKPGTVDGPVNTTLTLSTNAVTLACGQQAQVVASVTTTATTAPTLSTAVTTSVSPATALTAAATGNTVTVTRGGTGTVGPALTPPANTTATVVVGAGNAPAQTLLITTPSACP
jgi:large repetitive protein